MCLACLPLPLANRGGCSRQVNQIKPKRTEQPAGLQRLRADRETISVPESERSDENGMVILSRVNACAPPIFCILRRAWENRRVRRACRPSGAISSERSKAKEQSNVFSPTETPLKEHQPNKLQKPENLNHPSRLPRRDPDGSIRPVSVGHAKHPPKPKTPTKKLKKLL